MARITVEDCLRQVDNMFDLVLLAACRARRLANGAEPLDEIENDKPTVLALREIADGLINEDILTEIEQTPEELTSQEELIRELDSIPPPSGGPRDLRAP